MVAVALYGLFAGWWSLLMLVFGLGRCGEDSDIDATDEFDRLCDDPTSGRFDGVIFTNLAIIGLTATAATAVLAGVALWRRAWWPLALLAIALVAAAALGWNADRV